MTVGTAAGLVLSAEAIVREAPFQVPGDEQVEFSVLVVVQETGARAPTAGLNAGARRDIGERSVTVVVVQRVAPESGDVDVFETIVVEIAHGHSHAITILRHSGEARFFGDVGKRAVRILPVETVPEFPIGL